MARRDLAAEGERVKARRLLSALAPFGAALITVALVTAIAGAHDTDLTDPNDTRGSLDVRQVRLAHKSGPHAWTIVTFGRWRTGKIWDRGYLMVLLDTQGKEDAEFYLLVRSAGSGLLGSLWRVRNVGPDSFLGSVPVQRFSRLSATVRVGLSRLTFGAHRLFYRWWVQTLFTGEICKRTCQDRAPNRDPVVQWRPGMSPTPSPSPSESASP